MDSLNLLTDLADLDDLMFSLDLASGYHQVDMDPRYYTYLGFQWEGEFYVFRVLPFGLASAPWCFTKIMRTISLYLRFRGSGLLTTWMTSFSWSLIPSLQHTGSWFWTLSNQLAWQSMSPSLFCNSHASWPTSVLSLTWIPVPSKCR